MSDEAKSVEAAFCRSLTVLFQLNNILVQKVVQTDRDLAALRETVKIFDPTFEDVYSRNLKIQKRKNPALNATISELLKVSGEMLEALREMQKQLS